MVNLYARNFGQEELNQSAIKLLEIEVNQNSLDDVERIFASATYIERYKNFKNQHGLDKSTFECICKLTKKECDVGCNRFVGSLVLDHGELWYKDNQPYMFVAQPYVFNMADAQALTRYCLDNGLTYEIWGRGYHFPSTCTVITITKQLREV